MPSLRPEGLLASRAFGAICLILVAACGGSSSGTLPPGDGGTPPPNGFPAPHPPIPLVQQQGGPFLKTPRLVTVTFTGDPLATQLFAFSDAIPASTWWAQVTGDYGVGAITSATADHVTVMQAAAPQYTDSVSGGSSSIAAFLQQSVSDGVIPDPTDETIYLVYFPPNTMVNLDGSSSCVQGGFAGYHTSTKITPKAGGAAVDASYAIVVRCDPPVPQLMMTEQTYMTISGSHELVEAATDGKPVTQGFAWATNDLGWGIFGPEVADLCADSFGTGQDEWDEAGFAFQRSWSNSSAQGSHDPCVPIKNGEVYFNAAPQTELVQLGIGGSAQVELQAFSDAPMAAWQLKAIDVGAATVGTGTSMSLSLSLDKATVKNGDTASLTIKLDAAIPAYPGAFPAKTTVVYVVSLVDPAHLSNLHFWPIVVQQSP